MPERSVGGNVWGAVHNPSAGGAGGYTGPVPKDNYVEGVRKVHKRGNAQMGKGLGVKEVRLTLASAHALSTCPCCCPMA